MVCNCRIRPGRMLKATQPSTGMNRVPKRRTRWSTASWAISDAASAFWAASREAAVPKPTAGPTTLPFFSDIVSSCLNRPGRMLKATQPKTGTKREASSATLLSMAATSASSVAASAFWAASKEAAVKPIAGPTMLPFFFSDMVSNCLKRPGKMLKATQPRTGTNRVPSSATLLSIAAMSMISVAALALPAANKVAAAVEVIRAWRASTGMAEALLVLASSWLLARRATGELRSCTRLGIAHAREGLWPINPLPRIITCWAISAALLVNKVHLLGFSFYTSQMA
mmetsp:Transcript_22720/g.62729  ORF Transcript_22720/g.62729 Transcript_22720/m.62729 type:complete len:284 (-) Transcript_22720:23-874(-)